MNNSRADLAYRANIIFSRVSKVRLVDIHPISVSMKKQGLLGVQYFNEKNEIIASIKDRMQSDEKIKCLYIFERRWRSFHEGSR